MINLSEEKIECQYCGEEFSKRGIKNHEKYCEENLDDVKKEDVVITPKKTLTLNVKGSHYKLFRGRDKKVPVEVAEALEKINLC